MILEAEIWLSFNIGNTHLSSKLCLASFEQKLNGLSTSFVPPVNQTQKITKTFSNENQ